MSTDTILEGDSGLNWRPILGDGGTSGIGGGTAI